MNSNARAWSGVGSEGISNVASSPSPAGTTRLRARAGLRHTTRRSPGNSGLVISARSRLVEKAELEVARLQHSRADHEVQAVVVGSRSTLARSPDEAYDDARRCVRSATMPTPQTSVCWSSTQLSPRQLQATLLTRNGSAHPRHGGR